MEVERTSRSVTAPLRGAPTIREGFFPPPTNRDLRGSEGLKFIFFIYYFCYDECECFFLVLCSKRGKVCVFLFNMGNLHLLRLQPCTVTTQDVNVCVNMSQPS